MVHFGLQPRGTKAWKNSCEFRSPSRNFLFICIKASVYLRSSRENRACGGFFLMSLFSLVSPKHTPEPSMDFAEMLQIESKGSSGLRHCSHDLPRPENTEARDLDLRDQQGPTQCARGIPSFLPSPSLLNFKKKYCWTQISAPAAETNTPFILLLRKLRPKEVGSVAKCGT